MCKRAGKTSSWKEWRGTPHTPTARPPLPREDPLHGPSSRGLRRMHAGVWTLPDFLGPERCAPSSSALNLSLKLEAAPLTQACTIHQPSARRWRRRSQPSWRAFSLHHSWSAVAPPVAPGHPNFLTGRGNRKFMHRKYTEYKH